MRSHDPEEMEEPTLRGSKELYFITLSHLETPAQRKPCGYKEGKCNRCNRMQQRLHCFACFNERCLLSRLSIPFEFHSLFPFSSALPSFLFSASKRRATVSSGASSSFHWFRDSSARLRSRKQQRDSRQVAIDRERHFSAAAASSHSHAATFSRHEQQSETTGSTGRARRWRGQQQRQ